MKRWISWFIRETGVDGVRLDAIKHINDWFIRDFMLHARGEFGDDFYAVGEYSYYDGMDIEEYLHNVEHQIDLFDVALQYNFKQCSEEGPSYDMRKIFGNSLVSAYPHLAVTYVDNHDSHLNEGDPYVQGWFKPLAYALILLRKEGYPCLFLGDYYGIGGEDPRPGMQWIIDQLLDVRRDFAYGDQEDYFDHEHVVGWVRRGDEHHPDGCVVIMSNAEGGVKPMFVGTDYAGSVWHDKLGHIEEKVVIGDDGRGWFPVGDGSVSVYLKD